MKPVTMFMMASCPHCRRALAWMDEAKREKPAYGALEITMIDEVEQPEAAAAYDYYYVPTYYIDGEKVHEGAASLEIVKDVLERALNG